MHTGFPIYRKNVARWTTTPNTLNTYSTLLSAACKLSRYILSINYSIAFITCLLLPIQREDSLARIFNFSIFPANREKTPLCSFVRFIDNVINSRVYERNRKKKRKKGTKWREEIQRERGKRGEKNLAREFVLDASVLRGERSRPYKRDYGFSWEKRLLVCLPKGI